MPRILALDFGLRRIGAAISDAEGRIASPLEVYERKSPPTDARHYQALVADERVDRIVVGLPLHTTGRESDLTAHSRAFGAWLAATTNRPVTFHDERYTSVLAEEILSEHRVTAKRRKELRDRLAAQILLQSFLDAGCPESELPASPLDDPSEGLLS